MRVHATGRKVYVVQSRGPTGPKRATLGRHGDLSTDEARKQAAVAIDRIKRGDAPLPAPPEPTFTVAALAEHFLRVHVAVQCKPSTAGTYRHVLDRHILPALGTMAVDAVGRGEVTALHHRLRETPYIANQTVTVLSKMFSLAEAWERIALGRNPCRSVRFYKEHARERFLTQDELRSLGRALRDAEADGSVGSASIAALRLLILTGCRRGEILTLRWDDVDRVAGELRLRDAKTGPRRVPLTGPVAVVLDGIAPLTGNPWVIPGRRPGAHLTSLNSAWPIIRAKAGLEDVRVHDLRHSYASRALALGESVSTIGKLLGHRKVETTARYAHLMRDAEKGAAARVGDSIGVHLVPRSAEAA